jgi:hypothetical protein
MLCMSLLGIDVPLACTCTILCMWLLHTTLLGQDAPKQARGVCDLQVRCKVSLLPRCITGFSSLELLDLHGNPELHVDNNGGEVLLTGTTYPVLVGGRL